MASTRHHGLADNPTPGLQDVSLLRSKSNDSEGNKSWSAVKPAPEPPAAGCFSRCGTPFGRGYSAIAHAYRHQAQGLTAAELRELAGPLPADGAAALGGAYGAAAGGGGGRLRAALAAPGGRAPLEAALLELLAAALEAAAVLCLGAVLQDYERGSIVPSPWLENILGSDVAGHPGLRVAPLVASSLLGQLLRQCAQHRRAQAASKAEAALRSWAFRCAAASDDPAAPPLPQLLAPAPELAAAWSRRSGLRVVAHGLGAGLALAVLLQALGLAGLAAAPVTGLLLLLEAAAKRRWASPWQARAADLRAQREALLRELLASLAAVKAFAWERLYFRRLALLRGAERRALRRAARGAAVQAALRPELWLLLPGAACLGARARFGPLGLGAEGGLQLWQAFQALAACHVLAEQLARLGAALAEPWPGESARALEAAVDGLAIHATPPPQGTRSSYKASRYAVKVEGMRFFWPDADATKPSASTPPEPAIAADGKASPDRPQSVAPTSAMPPSTGGLDLVDEYTDDASVAERARRAAHGAMRFDLRVLSFQAKRGALVALAGATGCGKSTLLAALLGACGTELWGDDADGTGVVLSGRLAYVPQQAQVMSGRSIRDNVLCGLQPDTARYERVLTLSTLAEDLAKLPRGDASDVSELPSDGARMCLQLARALYVEAEIMLIDDPFVAMERDRAKQVMSQCIKALIKQRERTVVLATQSLALLSEVENVVVLRNGTVFEQGDYKTLVSMPTEFSRMLLIANKKEGERAQERRHLTAGVPCPFLSYEVAGPDPMREAFPLDAEWEAEGYELGGGGLQSTSTRSNFWVSQQHQVEQPAVPATPRDAAGGLSAPWDTQKNLGREAGGVALRGGVYATVAPQPAGTPRAGGKQGGKSEEQPQVRISARERKGGTVQRRRGFALDALAAKQIQDYFGAQQGGSAAGTPRSPGASELGELFATRNKDSGGDSARSWRRKGRSAEAVEVAESSTPRDQGAGAGLFGGDFGLPDDGVGLYGQRPHGGLRALPQLPEADDGEQVAAPVAGTAASALESFGDFPPQRRAAPSASGVPAVGATEVDMAQHPVQAPAASAAELPMPALPSNSIADDFADEVPAPVATALYGDSGARPSQDAWEDLEAGPWQQPGLRPEVRHGAPPPPNVDGERPRRTSKGSSSKSSKGKASSTDDPRLERLDALERALKEKNKQIAQLERQMAVGKESSGSQDGKAKGSQAKRGPAPVELAAPPAPAPPRPAARARAPPCLGTAAGLLLRAGGLAGVALALLFVLTVGLHLAAQYALGQLLLGPAAPAAVTGDAAAGAGDGAGPAEGAQAAPTAAPAPSPSAGGGSSSNAGSAGGAGTDPGDGLWIGFDTPQPAAAPTAAPAATTAGPPPATTTTLPALVAVWGEVLPARFCIEEGLPENDPPAEGFSLDTNYGWYLLSGPVSLGECKRWCEDTAGWGCRYISWGRMGGGTARWCYLHRGCTVSAEQQWYQVLPLNVAEQPGRRLLPRRLQETLQQPAIFRHDQLPPLLLALCLGLALAAPAQAFAATAAASTAGQEALLQQLRAVLAAALPLVAEQEPWLRARLVDDAAAADSLLPMRLGQLLAALGQVLAAAVAAAVACGRQAVLAVTLVLASGLAIYLHRMRLPLLSQLRRLRAEAETAASLRLANLAECHGVLRAHRRLEALCDEFDGLCNIAAQAAITRDLAERWLYTRLHCLGAVVLGVLAFCLLGQAADGAAAPAAAALLQAALLPALAAAAARQGAAVAEGLAALRRLRELRRELPAEELESPVLRMRPASAREEKDVERGKKVLQARSGHTMLGESLIQRGSAEELAAAMYDLSRLEREQTISVEGFPLEPVADDWPYFGAVDFEDVTMRYAPGAPAALQGLSLSLPASGTMLVVGQAGSGKSSLVHTLLRLGETEAGRIIVDCIDTRSVGLTTLRSRVALVPQDVPLFGETWRESLDPLGEFSDEQLRLALCLTRLQNWLAQHAERGLDGPLPAGGRLDPALRALLGLCRAVLRLLQKRSKLLIMDCTTCRLNVSSDADLTTLIHRFCHRREAAVLQLSRRVNQAQLYDEAAVLQGGRITEHGPPKKLWSKDSALRRLAREQGVDSSRMTKPQVVADRLASMTSWDVNPQQDPDWSLRFSVSLKKPKAQGSK